MTLPTASAVAVAVILDATLREPPLRIHPVRLVGRYLRGVASAVPANPPLRAVTTGGLAWAAGATTALAAGIAAERTAARLPPISRAVVLGIALWPLFAHRMLLDEVAAVEDALADDLEAGRTAVGRLVSRDVTELTATQVRQAAIESLAEKLADSVVAPLMWFAVGGLPAAALYRYANTADAMWGYRTPRWRHAGTVAARADDVLNLIPARLTAGALSVLPFHDHRVSPETHQKPVIMRRLRAEAGRTPSPNAGWPMAAVALRLGIRLEKPGVYRLSPTGREPTTHDTRAALRLARRVGLAAAGVAAVVAGLRAQLASRRLSGMADGGGR